MAAEITDKEMMAQLHAFVSEHQLLLRRLWRRWQDEREHEDINEYGKEIAKKFPEGWKLEKSMKRPFGVRLVTSSHSCDIAALSNKIRYSCASLTK